MARKLLPNVFEHMDAIKDTVGETITESSVTDPSYDISIREIIRRGANAPDIARDVEFDGSDPDFDDIDPTAQLGFDRIRAQEVLSGLSITTKELKYTEEVVTTNSEEENNDDVNDNSDKIDNKKDNKNKNVVKSKKVETNKVENEE